MTSQKSFGGASQSKDLSKSVSNSHDSSNERVAAVAVQLVREMFPVNQQESDAAAALRIELLAEVVGFVGPEHFMTAIKQAISISKGRYDCTIAKIRECAGLQHVPDPAPAMKAWMLVTEVVQRHVRPGMEGGYRLEPYTYRKGDEVLEIPVPVIPEPVLAAVRCLGGWGALWVTEPAYWSQRMRDFCGVYDESSFKRDCAVLMESKRAKV